MKQLLLRVSLSACALLVLSWGVLSVFFPRKLQKFMGWYSRIDKWSAQSFGIDAVDNSLTQRIAGVFGIVIGILMLTWMFYPPSHPGFTAPVLPGPAEHPATRRLLDLGTGLGMACFGIYVALRPHIVLYFVRKNFPDRYLLPGMTYAAGIGGRILGILIFLVGGYLVATWFTQPH